MNDELTVVEGGKSREWAEATTIHIGRNDQSSCEAFQHCIDTDHDDNHQMELVTDAEAHTVLDDEDPEDNATACHDADNNDWRLELADANTGGIDPEDNANHEAKDRDHNRKRHEERFH